MNAAVQSASVAKATVTAAKPRADRRETSPPARLLTTKTRPPTSTGKFATARRAAGTEAAAESLVDLRETRPTWRTAVESAQNATQRLAAWPRRASVKWSAAT